MPDTDGTPAVLVMIGDIDIASEQEWRARGDELFAQRPDLRDLTVDLSQVTFLDSRGMATLVHLHGRALDRGGKLRLRGTPNRVMKALNVAGLDQIFQIEDV
jgi:anti-anti-sigma factor